MTLAVGKTIKRTQKSLYGFIVIKSEKPKIMKEKNHDACMSIKIRIKESNHKTKAKIMNHTG